MLSFYLNMLETEEERQSFAEFYEETHVMCYRIALGITHNPDWAEEAVLDAFLRMIREKDRYYHEKDRKKRASSIVIMVKSYALNISKQERRLDHTMLNDVDLTMASGAPDAFRFVSGKETVERLKKIASKMEPMYRTVFEMKFLLEMSVGEIADTLGISNNAVSMRIYRIRQELQNALGEEVTAS